MPHPYLNNYEYVQKVSRMTVEMFVLFRNGTADAKNGN